MSSVPHCDNELYLSQVVDVELYRNSLGEDYLPQPSSSKVTHRVASPTLAPSMAQSYGPSSSPIPHDPSVDKGMHTETSIMENCIHRIVVQGPLWSFIPYVVTLWSNGLELVPLFVCIVTCNLNI